MGTNERLIRVEGERNMRGTRHGKQGDSGVKTAELCRQHNITEVSYFRWKAKYGGMDVSDAKKLKHLEEENRVIVHYAMSEAVLADC
jgi:hypothetical protein